MAPPPPPRKIVTHPIADEADAGALFLYGEPGSSRIALLCAGYPDDHEVFQAFASRLAKEGQCLVGVTCLPGFDDREDRPYSVHNPNGYSLDDMVGSMREAVKILRRESTFSGEGGKGASLIGVFHDWGIMPGCMYTNRTLEEGSSDLIPDKVVLFDVMGPPHPDTKDMPDDRKDTLFETIVTLSYRTVFACSFLVRRYISKLLAPIIFLGGMIPLGIFRLAPTLAIDDKVFEQRCKKPSLDRIIYMAHPYCYLIKSALTGKALDGSWLPYDLTKTPVLYMYGTEKRVMFHDRRSLALLERENKQGRKSKAVMVEGAGHYLYRQEEDICMEEVVKFITDA